MANTESSSADIVFELKLIKRILLLVVAGTSEKPDVNGILCTQFPSCSKIVLASSDYGKNRKKGIPAHVNAYSSGGDAVSGIPMSAHLLGGAEDSGVDVNKGQKGLKNGLKTLSELGQNIELS